MPKFQPSPVIGSFEDIGKDIVSQISQIPKDIGAKALESLGAGSAKGNQSGKNTQFVGQADGRSKINQAFDNPDLHHHNQKVRAAIARSALEALSKQAPIQEESVYEKQMREMKEKTENEQNAREEAEKKSLRKITHVKARGDLYGLTAKKQGSEIGKNIRHD